MLLYQHYSTGSLSPTKEGGKTTLWGRYKYTILSYPFVDATFIEAYNACNKITHKDNIYRVALPFGNFARNRNIFLYTDAQR
jgi:hypothetical protein